MLLTDLNKQLCAMSPKQLEMLCRGANVPYKTALKIRYGASKNPRVKTVEALARALKTFYPKGLPHAHAGAAE